MRAYSILAALVVVILCSLATCMLICGCGDDESPRPVESVSLSIDSTGVNACQPLDIFAEVTGGETQAVAWYVNDIAGGNSTVGTITPSNPATYAAPGAIPAPATVVVKAVSDEDPSKADSCKVTVNAAAATLYVNGTIGSDETGTGCVTKPFKSITHALAQATSGITVQVASGLYDAANGEVFPLTLGQGIALVGEDWEATIVRGHAEEEVHSYGSAIAIEGANASLRKFTIEQSPVTDPFWKVAIYVDNTAANAVIDSVRTDEYADFSFIRLDGAPNALISNSVFTVAGAPHTARGFEVVESDALTVIRNCTISGYYSGIFVNVYGAPLIEGCTIEDNRYGISLWYEEASNPNPDLGGGARGSSGGNIIRNNTYYGIDNTTTNAIYAKYNTWTHTPPTVGSANGSDICNTGGGSVVWE